MPTPLFLLLPEPSATPGNATPWRVVHRGRVETVAPGDHDGVPIEALRTAARDLGALGRPVWLGVPGDAVLPVRVPSDAPLTRPEARAFAAEAELPVAAEAVVATATQPIGRRATTHGDTLLLTGLIDAIRPTIDALEAAGFAVDRVVPTAWWLAQPHADPTADAVALRHPPHHEHRPPLDLFWLDDAGQPVAWRRPADDETLARETRRWRLNHTGEPRVRVVELDDAAIAEALSRADADGPVDLRTGALAPADPARRWRGPLNAALLATAALLLAASAWVGVQAHRAEQAAAIADRQQEAAFAAAMPNQPVPLAVRGRLTSERNRLRGATGLTGAPDQASAMTQLDRVLAALSSGLPSDLRYRVLEARVEPDRITLDGEARVGRDVDRIAAALRADMTGWTVTPPRVERLPDTDGVRFSLALTSIVDASGSGDRNGGGE